MKSPEFAALALIVIGLCVVLFGFSRIRSRVDHELSECATELEDAKRRLEKPCELAVPHATKPCPEGAAVLFRHGETMTVDSTGVIHGHWECETP